MFVCRKTVMSALHGISGEGKEEVVLLGTWDAQRKQGALVGRKVGPNMPDNDCVDGEASELAILQREETGWRQYALV